MLIPTLHNEIMAPSLRTLFHFNMGRIVGQITLSYLDKAVTEIETVDMLSEWVEQWTFANLDPGTPAARALLDCAEELRRNARGPAEILERMLH